MAITRSTAAKNAAANAVVDLLDAGSGAGVLVLLTAGDVEVATLTFSDPAYGAASAGTCQENSITDDSSATGGTTTKFEARDSDANVVFEGTVGLTGSGADLELTNNVIAASETVSVTDLSYTAT